MVRHGVRQTGTDICRALWAGGHLFSLEKTGLGGGGLFSLSTFDIDQSMTHLALSWNDDIDIDIPHWFETLPSKFGPIP